MSDKKQKSPLKKYTAAPVLKKTSVQAAGGLGGLGLAFAADKAANAKQGVLIPAVMLGLGLAGLHYFNVNPPKDGDTLMELAKGASVGGAVFGGLKTLQYGLPKITMNGLNGGFIPKSVSDKILSFIPTFNGMGAIDNPSGYYDDPMASMMGAPQNPDYYLPSYTPEVINGLVEGEFQVAEVL